MKNCNVSHFPNLCLWVFSRNYLRQLPRHNTLQGPLSRPFLNISKKHNAKRNNKCHLSSCKMEMKKTLPLRWMNILSHISMLNQHHWCWFLKVSKWLASWQWNILVKESIIKLVQLKGLGASILIINLAASPNWRQSVTRSENILTRAPINWWCNSHERRNDCRWVFNARHN